MIEKDKNILDKFFDRADEVLDHASILSQIGTPEEEEERSRPKKLVDWKFVPSSKMWHAFLVGTDDTRCGRQYEDTHVAASVYRSASEKQLVPVKDPEAIGVTCCAMCMIRTVR